ncbi:OsmC family protein [Marinilabiliaceae bacterium ANBcel2]|nr:OsmC family protein [Marinilabiliaceae bacterium ANBcel2]
MAKVSFSVKGDNVNATRIDLNARQFKLVVDEPANLGGTDDGANPVEYLLAGLAGCLNVVGHTVAKEMGIKINKLSVEVSGDLNPARFMGQSNAERAGFQNIETVLHVDTDADKATLKEWLEKVEDRCPVNDNLSNTTPVSVKLG